MNDEYPRSSSSELRLAIILFVVAVLIGVSGAGYAVYSFGVAQNNIIKAQDVINKKVQQQNVVRDSRWCTVLDLLTGTPVPKPADPKANPSRVASYELYQDFVQLRKEFRCPLP